MKRGKKYVEAAKNIDRQTLYEATEAVSLVKKSAVAKFDETIEAHIRTGCDGRHADQQIRGAVVLPHGTGKTVKVLVFAKGAKAEDAGSWGAWAKYYDQGAQTYVAHTTDANTFGMTGFKGFGVGANYTIAKNIVANVAYYNTESKLLKELPGIAADMERTKDHRFWTDVTFTF